MPRKKCTDPGCEKRSQGKTDKCISHGGGTRCIVIDCLKSARFKTDKCKAHGGGARCVVIDCPTSARDNSDTCIAHGGGTQCIDPNCDNSDIGKCDTCVRHGANIRCVESGCNKSARSKSGKFVAHGGGRRCIEIGCVKSAIDKNYRCKAHGGGARCIEPGCKKSAIAKTERCVAHGGGKRCPNCVNWIDTRAGSKHYDGYCATCFKQVFPDDDRSKVLYLHTKEIRVRNAINENFEGFIHDKPLYTGQCDCTMRRRIDHRKLIDATLLCIETDEFAHKRYDPKDEELRYDDLFMVHSGKWIFIRFNPDGKGVDMVDKLKRLIEEIHFQIMRIKHSENTELLEVIKLYYS